MTGFDEDTLTEAGFPTLTFERLEVGTAFESDDRLIRPQDVEAYAFAIDDHDPWFFEAGPFDGPVVHPTILANQALFLRHSQFVVPAGLHARMNFEFVGPIRLGDRARTSGRVVDKYVRRDKPYMVTEFETLVPDRGVVTRGQFTQMLFASDRVPASGGERSPAPPSHPPTRPELDYVPGRSGLLTLGAELGPVAHTIEQRQIDTYSGVRPRSIHTDPVWARAKGFESTIAQGMMSTAYVSQLMTTHIGAGFIEGGHMDVRFLQPVLEGDTIAATATIVALTTEPDGIRVHADVTCRNQRGNTTLAGTASGLVHERK